MMNRPGRGYRLISTVPADEKMNISSKSLTSLIRYVDSSHIWNIAEQALFDPFQTYPSGSEDNFRREYELLRVAALIYSFLTIFPLLFEVVPFP
jgi:hypothetical protein